MPLLLMASPCTLYRSHFLGQLLHWAVLLRSFIECSGSEETLTIFLLSQLQALRRGPEQIVRQHRGDAKRDASGSSVTAEGRAELSEAMRDGLGDHILLLRLFQVLLQLSVM